MSLAFCDEHKVAYKEKISEQYIWMGMIKKGQCPKKRVLLEGMTFECPKCHNDMEVYEHDKRARGWFRAECKQCGAWIDIVPDTGYLKHKR